MLVGREAELEELVEERGVSEVTGLLPGGAGELAALVPELGSPPSGGDPEMARGRLFGLLLVLLEQLAAKQPLVLVIEDLHWADRSTGELLAFLVRNLQQAAVLGRSPRGRVPVTGTGRSGVSRRSGRPWRCAGRGRCGG